MSRKALAISATGLVCGVGTSAPSACAAIRCGINNFQETRFVDRAGEWIIGSAVPMEQAPFGTGKLITMAAQAARECLLADPGLATERTPLLLCLAEETRPGRWNLADAGWIAAIESELGVRFHGQSKVIGQGRVAAAIALYQAQGLLSGGGVDKVLIAGVDSLLAGPTLRALEAADRLFTSQNSNGFMPGEAAGAFLVELPKLRPDPQLVCVGMGFAHEAATVESDIPLRAEGLSQAIKAALADAGCDLGAVDFRIADVAGEQYHFKEAALAMSRTLRARKERFDLWHPADCIGEVGAATLPAMVALLREAMVKQFAPGNSVLCHLGNDDGRRAALIMTYQTLRTA